MVNNDMTYPPDDHEFMHGLGQFVIYMKAEHDADIIGALKENPELLGLTPGGGLEVVRFLYQSYRMEMTPKDIADRLIAAVDGLYG